MTSRQRFLNALLRLPVDRAPVANPNTIVTVELQERAGAFFPEAHHDAETMARLAAAGRTVCGYDTVFPVFGAGTAEAAALGVPVQWGDRNHLPAIAGSIWSAPDEIAIRDDILERPTMRAVLDAIRLLRRQFGDEVAIIGKVYGPWSLAYHTFGIQPFLADTLLDPGKVAEILRRLTPLPIRFAKAQLAAGADAINLCDHITRALIGPEAYPRFLLERHREIRAAVDAPLILHCCGPTLDRVEQFNASGIACFNFDSTNDLREMRARSTMVLLGNINCPVTLRGGTPQAVRAEVFRALDAGVEIIGPECAMPMDGKLANLIAIREAVEAYFGNRPR